MLEICRPLWTPEPGEIVWVMDGQTESQAAKNGLPEWAVKHLAVVLHVTQNQEKRTRNAWIIPISSIGEGSEFRGIGPQYIHFQTDHEPPVAGHNSGKCSKDCRLFLFLKPGHDGNASMKKPGYIDTSNVYELPLESLREKRAFNYNTWRLRDCSFAFVSEMVRFSISNLMMTWKFVDGTETLCPKLDQIQLQKNGLLCWVDTASRELIDSNGTAYEGFGPCVLVQNDQSLATIYILLPYRMKSPVTRTFKTLEADDDKVLAPVVIADESTDPDHYQYVSCGRSFAMTDRCVVVCPSFQVSIDQLYELPSCFLQSGARLSEQYLTQFQSPTSDYGKAIARFTQKRDDRDREKNRMAAAAEKATQTIKITARAKAEQKESERLRKVHKREKEKARQTRLKLFRHLRDGEKKVKTGIQSTKAAMIDNMDTGSVAEESPSDTELRVKLMDWIETEHLLSTVSARLQADDPVDENYKKMFFTSNMKMTLQALVELVIECGLFPPTSAKRHALRMYLGLSKEECHPLLRLVKITEESREREEKLGKGEEKKTEGETSTSVELSGESSDGKKVVSRDTVQSPTTSPE